MLPTSQDYRSEPTDIWFEKQIQNNTPPCHGWAGCITDWLTALTEKQCGSEALMPRCRLLIHSDCQNWSPILSYTSWHWLCRVFHTHLQAYLSLSVSAFLTLVKLPFPLHRSLQTIKPFPETKVENRAGEQYRWERRKKCKQRFSSNPVRGDLARM